MNFYCFDTRDDHFNKLIREKGAHNGLSRESRIGMCDRSPKKNYNRRKT